MNKGTIRAFAAGIILSTAVMAGYVHWFEPKDKGNISLDQAKSLLQQKGYRVTAVHNEEKPKESAKIEKPKLIEQKQEEKSLDPVSEKEPEKTEALQASSEPKKDRAADYKLSIRSGMTLDEIATLLAREGILKDASSFEDFMEENELSKQIQIGEYILTDNMTIQQVARTITK